MKKFFSLLEDNICAIILLVMMLLTCVNVVARYVLKASMPFVEELTCLGLIILGLTVLTDFFPAKGHRFCTLLGDLMGIIFGVLILWFGFFMAKQEYVLGQLTAGMQWPEWMFGMFVPISGGVLVIRYIQLFITHLVKKEEK